MKNEIIPYILANYPDLQTTKELLIHCHKLGIKYVELGIPFSDPSADGPVIQNAATKACINFNFDNLLAILLDLKKQNINLEITIMTYANPLYIYGISNFYTNFSSANVKGLLVPDIPFEERKVLTRKNHSIKNVWMISDNLPSASLKKIVSNSNFYLYLVAYLGTTGKNIQQSDSLKSTIAQVKKIKDIPVAIGFGIKDKNDVTNILNIADGAIIGTSLIIELDKSLNSAKEFLNNIIL